VPRWKQLTLRRSFKEKEGDRLGRAKFLCTVEIVVCTWYVHAESPSRRTTVGSYVHLDPLAMLPNASHFTPQTERPRKGIWGKIEEFNPPAWLQVERGQSPML
jgi:hypothetical protein